MFFLIFYFFFFIVVSASVWFDSNMSAEELRAELEALRAQHAALQEQLAPQDEPRAPTNSRPVSEVCKVAIKLPPFWADRPALWFAQAEAQFHLAGITTDMTMFSHVISIIDHRLIGEIEDIIMSPPDVNKYQTIKEELIRRLSTSEQQRVERLLSDEQLGDRKPSAFLRHLQSLAGPSKDVTILRQLWMRRLPAQVQAILAAQSDLALEKLAELADKIIEVTPGPSRVCKVDNSQPNLDAIMERLEKLGQQVAALTDKRQRGRSRARSASRSSRRSGTSADPALKLCWYHKKFGTKAAKCIPPCNWTSGNSTSSQ